MKISIYHSLSSYGNLRAFSSVIMEPHNSFFASTNLTHNYFKFYYKLIYMTYLTEFGQMNLNDY